MLSLVKISTESGSEYEFLVKNMISAYTEKSHTDQRSAWWLLSTTSAALKKFDLSKSIPRASFRRDHLPRENFCMQFWIEGHECWSTKVTSMKTITINKSEEELV